MLHRHGKMFEKWLAKAIICIMLESLLEISSVLCYHDEAEGKWRRVGCPTLSTCEGWLPRLSKTTDIIENAITQTIQTMGYRIVDVEIGKENGQKVLTVSIAHPAGIGLDDCERVSHAIDPILEELDPITDSYYLCVSSPGIDRPLKRPDDFKNAIGSEVEVRLYNPIDGRKAFTGILTVFDENADRMTILTKERGEMQLLRKDAARVKPVVTL